MIKVKHSTIFFSGMFVCSLVVAGCGQAEQSHSPKIQGEKSAQSDPKASQESSQAPERKKKFAQMQESMHAIANISTSHKGADFDFKFVLPSSNWEKLSHGAGDTKSSVWLFNLKDSGLKVMLSCAGEKEAPEFSKSAMAVYESSRKKQPDITREWKVGNFTLRRSFIGFIDERHGESTITAFSPKCTLEFNVASETMDRDELIKIAEISVEEFVKKNPDGGYPSK
jgi:hypothetical protein